MPITENLEKYAGYAARNTWEIILPEVSLAVLALVLLVLEMVLPERRLALVAKIALWGQVAVLLVGIPFSSYAGEVILGQTSFSGLLRHTLVSEVMRIFFLLSSILVCHIGSIYLERQQLSRVEFFHVTLVVTAGLMLLTQSNHFIMLFVALETVTVGFYVLVSYCRKSSRSLEAGLKYLLLGACSSAILLFGIVLLYGAAGNPLLHGSSADPMNFAELGPFIAAHPDNLLVLVGAILVLAGLAFKIGAVPFQIWIPDVYQGAPTPVAAFLAVASKAGGFVVLLNLVTGPFQALQDVLVPLLSTVAVLTILFGNIAALTQRNVKRLMGLSGVAHAGYMLVGVVASFTVDWAVYAILFYLLTYMLASFAVFEVMTVMAPSEDADQEIDDYEDLAKERPFLGAVLCIALGSLAGIPPLAGFIGKLLIFVAAFQAELWVLLAVSVIGVVISIYYYFGWIMAASFRTVRYPPLDDAEEVPRVWPQESSMSRIVLGCLTLATVAIGFYQGLLRFLLV